MKINNVELRVEITGDGAPFVWGHGVMASLAFDDRSGFFDWAGLGDVANLVRYDARGHGLSEATLSPEDYHWSNLAGDMISLMEHLGLDTFIAGGQSMGCATALYAALRAPERARALVLVNPPTAWETRAAQADNYERLAQLVESQGVDYLAELIRSQSLWPKWLLEVNPQINEVYVESIRGLEKKVLSTILRGAGLCDFPPREELKRLDVPAIILAWVDDSTHPLSTAEELHGLLRDSRLVVAKDKAGVDGWTRMVRDFISSLS